MGFVHAILIAYTPQVLHSRAPHAQQIVLTMSNISTSAATLAVIGKDTFAMTTGTAIITHRLTLIRSKITAPKSVGSVRLAGAAQQRRQ